MYNYKIITYPNGTTQLRVYSRAIKTGEDFDEWQFCPYFEWSMLDSISESEKHLIEQWKQKQLAILSQEDNKTSDRNYSVEDAARARQQLYNYSRAYDWEYFLTFTLSDKYVDRYNYDDCSAKIRKWLNNQKRASPELKYVIVPEQHKDGAWHFHGLLADCPGIKLNDSGHTIDGEKIYNVNNYRYGFTTATKVKDVERVAIYISKYITKSLLDMTKGRQRYYVSQNLPKPYIEKIYINEKEKEAKDVIAEYTAAHDLDIAYISNITTEYLNVDYIECKFKE